VFSPTGPLAPPVESSPEVTRLCRCTSPDAHHIRRGLPGTRVEPFSFLCDPSTPIIVKSYGKCPVGCPVCLILVVLNCPHASPLCGRHGCFFSLGFSSRIPPLLSGPCGPGRKNRCTALVDQGLRWFTFPRRTWTECGPLQTRLLVTLGLPGSQCRPPLGAGGPSEGSIDSATRGLAGCNKGVRRLFRGTRNDSVRRGISERHDLPIWRLLLD